MLVMLELAVMRGMPVMRGMLVTAGAGDAGPATRFTCS